MHFAKATKARRPRTVSLFAVALYLAFFFLVAAVSQLFAFEDYPALLASYMPIGIAGATVVGSLIVTLEVFAVPALLFMKLSPLMRFVSIIAGWATLLFWLSIGVWLSTNGMRDVNPGLFGARIGMPHGWWLVTYMAALMTLYAYLTWAHFATEFAALRRVAKRRS